MQHHFCSELVSALILFRNCHAGLYFKIACKILVNYEIGICSKNISKSKVQHHQNYFQHYTMCVKTINYSTL